MMEEYSWLDWLAHEANRLERKYCSLRLTGCCPRLQRFGWGTDLIRIIGVDFEGIRDSKPVTIRTVTGVPGEPLREVRDGA